MFDMKNFNTNLLHLTFKLGIPSLIPICFVKSIWFCQNETNLNKTGRYLPRSPIVGWCWVLWVLMLVPVLVLGPFCWPIQTLKGYS